GPGSRFLPATNLPATPRLVVFLVVVLVVILLVLVLVLFVFLFFVQFAALGLGNLVGQFLRMGGAHQHFFLLAGAFFPQLEQHLVEQEHAVLAARLDGGVNAIRFVLADQVLNGRRHHHHLEGRHQPLGLARQNGLGQHADQRRRELRPNLVLLLLG